MGGGVVLSGAVRAERVDYSGKRSVIAVHRPARFRDVSCPRPMPKSVDVIAMEETKVLTLPFARL